MKVGLKIMPRAEVLDTQGRAVENTLKGHGHQLNACTVGKYVIISLPEMAREQALAKAKEMAEFVLCNPLIETFEMDVL